jgi:transposase-like protein
MKANRSRDLRQAIRQAQRRGHPKHHRYAPALKLKVIAHTRAALSTGGSVAAVARSLELSNQTLHGWLQGQARRFRPVAPKAEDAPSERSELRLVTAQGHRVEGLSRDDLVALLRALA